MIRVSASMLLGALALSAPVFGGVIFSDSALNLAGYTQTTAFVSPAAISITPSNCASCGNGGSSALQIISSFADTTMAFGTLALGFVNNSFSYNPATQGALWSVSASVLKDNSINITATGIGNTFRPMIEQDGKFYSAAIPGPLWNSPTTGFLTLSQSGLLASDFVQFDFATGLFGTAHPNFSGQTMLFGLEQISTAQNVPFAYTAVYQNLRFDLAPVPEPSTLLLGSAGFALFGFRLWGRRRGSR